jgi:hypothetical protein
LIGLIWGSPLFRQSLFNVAKPALEFSIGTTQGIFRIHTGVTH